MKAVLSLLVAVIAILSMGIFGSLISNQIDSKSGADGARPEISSLDPNLDREIESFLNERVKDYGKTAENLRARLRADLKSMLVVEEGNSEKSQNEQDRPVRQQLEDKTKRLTSVDPGIFAEFLESSSKCPDASCCPPNPVASICPYFSYFACCLAMDPTACAAIECMCTPSATDYCVAKDGSGDRATLSCGATSTCIGEKKQAICSDGTTSCPGKAGQTCLGALCPNGQNATCGGSNTPATCDGTGPPYCPAGSGSISCSNAFCSACMADNYVAPRCADGLIPVCLDSNNDLAGPAVCSGTSCTASVPSCPSGGTLYCANKEATEAFQGTVVCSVFGYTAASPYCSGDPNNPWSCTDGSYPFCSCCGPTCSQGPICNDGQPPTCPAGQTVPDCQECGTRDLSLPFCPGDYVTCCGDDQLGYCTGTQYCPDQVGGPALCADGILPRCCLTNSLGVPYQCSNDYPTCRNFAESLIQFGSPQCNRDSSSPSCTSDPAFRSSCSYSRKHPFF